MSKYIEYPITWQGIDLTVRHCPTWLNGPSLQHIAVHSKDRAPLPITETGYRSHFMYGEDALDFYNNCPVSYVIAWLEQEAKSESWQMQKQGELF